MKSTDRELQIKNIVRENFEIECSKYVNNDMSIHTLAEMLYNDRNDIEIKFDNIFNFNFNDYKRIVSEEYENFFKKQNLYTDTKTFKTKIESLDSNEEFEIECYENDQPIEIGDYFLYFTLGIADITKCKSTQEKFEINPNNKQRNPNSVIDFVTGFWKNCYKIKSANFDLNLIEIWA